MDKLKSFIRENREEFEESSLPHGHMERFRKKLRVQKKIKQNYSILYGLLVAASVAILLTFILPNEWMEKQLKEIHEVCENREEFNGLRLYYEMQVYEIVSQMESLTEVNDSPVITGLMEASRQILSANKRFETTILPELPCSEDGLFVLNQHYTNSLQSLHIMLNQMELHTMNNNH